jgi:hypothetical protein
MRKSDDHRRPSRRQLLGRTVAVGGAATLALGTGLATAPGAAATTGIDATPGRAAGGDRGITGVYVLPNGETGFISGGRVHHTDWAKGTDRTIADHFPTLPSHFASGISVAYVRRDWVYAFISGDEIHRTDLGRKVIRRITDEFPELPASWRSEG